MRSRKTWISFGALAALVFCVELYSTEARADLIESVKSLFSWSTKQADDENCKTAAGEIKKSPPASSNPISSKNSAFKSEGELNRYMGCYLVEPGRYDDFKEWESYIRISAREFGVSQSLLTCLLFRESRFNPNARSRSGAIGLAQFLRSTMPTITNLIQAGKTDNDEVKKLIELAGKTPNTPQERKDKIYATARLKAISMGMKWESYFDRLRSEKKYKQDTPNEFNRALALKPATSIGAAGLYLRFIIDHFQDELKGQGAEATSLPSPGLDFHLAAAGAYNLGHGAAVNMLKKIRPAEPKAWKERLLKSRSETRDYILSLSNCATSASYNPEIAYKPPAYDPPRDCYGNGEIIGPPAVPERTPMKVASVSAIAHQKGRAKPAAQSHTGKTGKKKRGKK